MEYEPPQQCNLICHNEKFGWMYIDERGEFNVVRNKDDKIICLLLDRMKKTYEEVMNNTKELFNF